jgi:DNA invertase Pin-like site-specific DNA recombinase
MATAARKARPKRAAIYARISSADRLPDGTLDMLGIERQLEDCARYCKRHGWETTEYVENNRSASSYARKRRKQFDEMLGAVRNGEHDVIVVAELSRYTREPRIVEDLIDLSAAKVADLVSVNGGTYDVSTAEGKMRLRSEAMFAASYSDFVSDKVKRKKLQLRDQGYGPGTSRAFGYKGPDEATGRRSGMVVEPKEAKAIQRAVRDVLAGTTLSAVARRWNDAGFRTPRKAALWGTSTVRIVLTNPRYAGLLATQHGRDGRRIKYEIVGEAAWPAIISRADHDAIARLINDPERRKKRPARRTLLTGMVRCDCGAKMVSHGGGYIRCKRLPDNPACGSNGITTEPLEELIQAAVLYRLDTKKLWTAIDRAARRSERAQHGEDPDEIQVELDTLAEAIGEGLYSVREGLIIRKGLEERLTRAHEHASTDPGTRALAPFGKGNVEKVWANLSLDARRAVLGALIDHIAIAARTEDEKHQRGLFDPDRVDILWNV